LSKKILFFYPPNRRTIALETVIKEVKDRGNNIEVLTLSEPGDFHQWLEENGIKCYTNTEKASNSIVFYLKNIFFLISFCRKNKYEVVWSHLQPCNFIAVISQFFISTRVVIFRHHFHAIIKTDGLAAINKNEKLIEKITCSLAKELVVPSSEVYNGMVNYENIDPKKIEIIPYIYNFKEYKLPNEADVQKIRNKYACRLLLIMVARLIPMKRHILLFPVYKKLKKEGFDFKVLIMDEGEEKERLQEYVKENNLEKHVFFIGFTRNVLGYMAAADLMVHPSFTDASSSALKEMGILSKPVMVCKGVGDVDEYIVHQKNGWVITENNEAQQFEQYIKDAYEFPLKVIELGNLLKQTVLEKFSISDLTFKKYLIKLGN
jgi:glycosyltransferase involved in cell wall biosynthesis